MKTAKTEKPPTTILRFIGNSRSWDSRWKRWKKMPPGTRLAKELMKKYSKAQLLASGAS